MSRPKRKTTPRRGGAGTATLIETEPAPAPAPERCVDCACVLLSIAHLLARVEMTPARAATELRLLAQRACEPPQPQ